MAISLENVREAIEDFIGQGKDLMAKQRATNAISGAMVGAWLESHGYGQASPATVAKHINTLKVEGVSRMRESAKSAPLDEATLSRLTQVATDLQTAMASIIQDARQTAIEGLAKAETIYSTDEEELEATATVQLAEATSRIKTLEGELARARDEASMAKGKAEGLEAQLIAAQSSLERSTNAVRVELTAEFDKTRAMLETRIDQLTRDTGRIPDLDRQVKNLTDSLAKAEELREKAHQEFIDLTKEAESQSRDQHAEIVRLTNERGEEIQARLKIEGELSTAQTRLSALDQELSKTREERDKALADLKDSQEKAEQDIRLAEEFRGKAEAKEEELKGKLADAETAQANLQRRLDDALRLLDARNEQLNAATPLPPKQATAPKPAAKPKTATKKGKTTKEEAGSLIK